MVARMEWDMALVLGLPVGCRFVFSCPSDETKKAVLAWAKSKRGRKPRFVVDDPHGLLNLEYAEPKIDKAPKNRID